MATIPFVMCTIPFIWASGQKYFIDSMDQDLYEALKKINYVYKLFFPSIPWSGELVPKKIVVNHFNNSHADNAVAILV